MAAARALVLLDRVLPYLGPRRLCSASRGSATGRWIGRCRRGRRRRPVRSPRSSSGRLDDPARAATSRCSSPSSAWSDAETWVRLPSVAAAVVAAIAAYRLGRRLAGRHAGAAASLVLASSVGVVSLALGRAARLALAAMLLSSALFARAVERGNAVWWAVYAASAAVLPPRIPSPRARSRRRCSHWSRRVARWSSGSQCRRCVATLESLFFLTASVIDRADAGTAQAPSSCRTSVGVGRALGWSPVVGVLAVWGIVTLVRRSSNDGRGSGSPCS